MQDRSLPVALESDFGHLAKPPEPPAAKFPALPGSINTHVRRPHGARGVLARASSRGDRFALYGPTLALTATLAIACFMVVMVLALLLTRPEPYLKLCIELGTCPQNQDAKTVLYVAAFAVILPLSLVSVPRVTDRIAAGPNARALPALAGLLVATFAAAIILARLSRRLPWGDGLGVVLATVGIWWTLATAVLVRAVRPSPWPPLLRLAERASTVSALAGALLFGALLCVAKRTSLHPLPLVLGAAAVLGALVAYDRVHLPHLRRWAGTGVDLLLVLLLMLATANVVIFHASPVPPNPYFEPGIIQFHQDFLLGPTNQLLRGGGALLVNVPTSQYGVGSIYFLYGWFHLVPIGYGTYGFLDGILTALFYVAAYGVLRVSGVTRALAGAALAVGVVALLYSLYYVVGALPQQGPLRFGLPMVVILALTIATRWPRRARLARAVALAALGVSAIWAIEAFAYTAFTFGAVLALETALKPPGGRLRWLARQVGLGAAACLGAHLILAAATLAATGRLPDWGQYLAYVHAFLLGGKAGQVVYGFEPWSPGLPVGAAVLASAAAIVLLVRRALAVARTEQTALVALAGMTAYAIALFSYTDNRSSTYLLAYVTLPVLIGIVLWLSLLLRHPRAVSRTARFGSLAFASSVAVLLVAVAWPSVGSRFSQSALAHAYPGGGLRAAIHRLWHPPPIDPRAPEGERLLKAYIPGRRALVLLPASPDLATEILIRSGRANTLFTGDPKADGFVPAVWVPKVTRQIAALRAGQRILMDQTAQAVVAVLHAHPSIDPLKHAVGAGISQEEWILQRLDQRFQLRPIHEDSEGFVVAELVPRER